MIRAGMARAHTSLLYNLERLNGEGAWVVRPLMFSLSKTAYVLWLIGKKVYLSRISRVHQVCVNHQPLVGVFPKMT